MPKATRHWEVEGACPITLSHAVSRSMGEPDPPVGVITMNQAGPVVTGGSCGAPVCAGLLTAHARLGCSSPLPVSRTGPILRVGFHTGQVASPALAGLARGLALVVRESQVRG